VERSKKKEGNAEERIERKGRNKIKRGLNGRERG
tara:strand:+ start:189 stop:290 length:102 start_codon:yes stop_codon:yes gene_type:complete